MLLILTLAGLVGWGSLSAQAARTWRTLPEGQLPNDRRLQPLKDLNGYFPFHVPDNPEAWDQRKADLQRRVLVATGLWPMPRRTPLNAVIHGRVKRDGFTVDKVYFESVPGHFVSGLLFRPTQSSPTGKYPAVLSPHGHGGRAQDHGPDKIRKLIQEGQEAFADAGRYPKLARCAHLARMGCVTFIYDMEGYVDSTQISYQLAHRYAKVREGFDSQESWGFFGAQAEARLQSIMGLQTWNSIRALDFLIALPDVDANRIGVTGGSGGGTQTILLGAIDPRPVTAFPQGMVSTSMQGGCPCENTSLLRIGTGNVELAALFAPKPQAMTAANDWTRDMMTKGFPELSKLYGMLNRADHVDCRDMLQYPHNFNLPSRTMMYGWFNRHLKLGLAPEALKERHWKPLTEKEWTVWNEDHPKPPGGDAHERSLLRYLTRESDRQMRALAPKDPASWRQFHNVVGGAFEILIGRDLLPAGAIEERDLQRKDQPEYVVFLERLRVTSFGEELPVVSLYPKHKEWNGQVVLWIDGRGKKGLFNADGVPIPEVARLLRQGAAVLGADLFLQGEFLKNDQAVTRNRTVANKRAVASYTYGYNHSLFAQRVQDILTLISFVRHHEREAKKVHLVGIRGAGPWAAAARALAGSTVNRAYLDTESFRFKELNSYLDAAFLPGAVKYGDLPALLALSAPHPLAIQGESGGPPPLVRQAYQAHGKARALREISSASGQLDGTTLDWLIR